MLSKADANRRHRRVTSKSRQQPRNPFFLLRLRLHIGGSRDLTDVTTHEGFPRSECFVANPSTQTSDQYHTRRTCQIDRSPPGGFYFVLLQFNAIFHFR